jgi:hypothetical protein
VPPDPNELMTPARRAFVQEYERLRKFYALINDAPVIAEQYATGKLPGGIGRNPVGSPAPAFDRHIRPGMGAFDELRSHAPLIFQFFLSRAADNYAVYISNLLAEIFTHRPEVLRTSERVSLDDVLVHKSMQSFIATLAERRVNNLMNDGTRKLAEYVTAHMGFPLFDTPEGLDKMVEIGAVRNVIAHNRGVVDKRLAERLPKRNWPIGEPVPLTDGYLWDAMTNLNASVADIDRRAIQKFGLTATFE